jgi:hypothetical protein
MPAPSPRRVAAFAAALCLGAGVGACGDREQRQTGNPGQAPQSPGVRTGTNPAEATKTSTTNTSTLGRSNAP